ncbi:MAG: molybdate ABC transporter substrate-binding protein [Chromatiales bacterium]|nr:molybdate ABC transporter substrate-binding protein [Chromatiales bacterium]
MFSRKKLAALFAAITLTLAQGQAMADEILVAVASNFTGAIKALAARFEQETGHAVVLSFGSTGKHYAQIRHGAPYHAFFAADVQRPRLLEEEERIVPGSRHTYAFGRLVLWSLQADRVDTQGKVLATDGFARLAVANPRLAPYGTAAQQVLEARGLWDTLQPRLVRGENIGQTYQYVQSGAAELGFVAYSQIRTPDTEPAGSAWIVPEDLYAPIEQQAVLLKDTPTARAFMAFMRSEEAAGIIEGYGYGVARE